MDWADSLFGTVVKKSRTEWGKKRASERRTERVRERGETERQREGGVTYPAYPNNPNNQIVEVIVGLLPWLMLVVGLLRWLMLVITLIIRTTVIPFIKILINPRHRRNQSDSPPAQCDSLPAQSMCPVCLQTLTHTHTHSQTRTFTPQTRHNQYIRAGSTALQTITKTRPEVRRIAGATRHQGY
jgi:hypothetical protein